MIRATCALAILVLSLAACGTPNPQATGAGPTASPPSAASANPGAAFCAALDEHALKAAVLADLDPATSTLDEFKAAAADAQATLTALVIAFAASGLQAEFGHQLQQIQGPSKAVSEAIEQLPAGATAEEMMDRLAGFGWPEPLITDQQVLFAELRDAAC